MYHIAARVRDWISAGLEPAVAVVVGVQGLSTHDPGAARAWTADEAVGTLGAGLDERPLTPAANPVEVTITDDDAVAAGLACGGRATVLTLPARAFPAETWDRLMAREPVCIVAQAGGVQVFTPETVRTAGGGAGADLDIARLFGRGTTDAATSGDTAAIAYWPVPTLVVVGDGLIAAALVAGARFLGWGVHVEADLDPALARIEALHRSDAMIVLSHDRAVDGPVLAAALSGPVGYVGALGARHTQLARATWLTEHGVGADDIARIHGPAGLDIDAHTPAEIAVSVVAEIIAARSGSVGGALRDRGGPVHVAGVQAPPPRY